MLEKKLFYIKGNARMQLNTITESGNLRENSNTILL